eukprot:gene37362-45364_t
MWGARRKREADDDEDAVAKLHKEHKEIKRKEQTKASPKIQDVESMIDRQVKAKTRKVLADADPAASSAHMLQLIEQYLGMVEQLLDSDDFSTLYDEDTLKTYVAMVQQYLPEEVTKDLGSLSDPATLQAVAKEGLKAFRQSFEDFMKIVENPDKVAEFMESLPPDVAEVLGAVMRGDKSVLVDKLNEVPGLDTQQKRLLTAMLRGDSDGLEQQIKQSAQNLQSLVQSDEQMEQARQQILANPEMAAMFGIPEDILNDPKLWKETMAEGLNALKGMEGLGVDAEESKPKSNKQNSFSRARRAA